MSFREVQVHEIREVLRLWLRGEGHRSIERLSSVNRKTVRRYVGAAVSCAVARDGGEGQLTDELIGQVCELVRPHRLERATETSTIDAPPAPAVTPARFARSDEHFATTTLFGTGGGR
jgi:hypothetical protein